MKQSTQAVLKLAATGGAFLVGGPLASLAIGAVASPEFLHFANNLLGESSHHVLKDLPASGQHFIQHVTAHLFGHQLHALAGRGPNGGYNHDMRRGMVLAIHNTLGAQIADLNVPSPRHADAWTSGFKLQFLRSIAKPHSKMERHLEELFALWRERLYSAVEDKTGRRLEELFPHKADGVLPADSSQFDEAVAEAAAYAAACEGKVAGVWNDIFDQVLTSPRSESSATPAHRWFGFGPRKAEPTYDLTVHNLLNAIAQNGITPAELRAEVTRFLQHHFSAEFAEVVKDEHAPEHRKAWIAYQKLLLEATRAEVVEVTLQMQSIRDDQRKDFTDLAARIQALAELPSFVERLANSSANVIAVLGQESGKVTQTVREESAKLASILAAIDSKLEQMPRAVVDELEKLGLVRPLYATRKLDRLEAAGIFDRIWPISAEVGEWDFQRVSTRGLGRPQSEVNRRFPIGSHVRVVVETNREEHLLLLDESPNGTLYCLCPSLFAPDSKLAIGRSVLPAPQSIYKSFVLTGPDVGQERLFAILTSEPLRPDWLSSDNTSPARVLNSGDIDRLMIDFESLGAKFWTILVARFEVTSE